jgi:UDP-N-acetyl-D-glucosamine dehydrogenase
MASQTRKTRTGKTRPRKHADELIRKIENREITAGIVGRGYVGLPLAISLVEAGFTVIGFDISKEKVKLLKSGRSDIDDITDREVRAAVDSGRFRVTSSPKRISECEVVSICVPTPLSKTKDPDVSYILSAMDWVSANVSKGAMVVLESTTYPGTTEDLILPLMARNGWKPGVDFFLAFSPERVDPGNPKYNTRNTPRVVGGVTPDCTRVAKVFYEQGLGEVHPVSSPRAAEMVKLLENTFRSVNIGLVNEVALMCDRLDIDVWEIIDAAATKPFGFMPFYPGPGLGGHCIPIDPHYLSWKLKSLNYFARFIELAGDINSHMPEYVVERVTDLLNTRFARALNKSTILLLGIAYKKDIKDIRESPALDVIKLLQDKGAKVVFNDPHVGAIRWEDKQFKSSSLTPALLKRADLTIILTNHTAYDYQMIVDHARVVFDTRNATKEVRKNRSKIELL